MYCTYLTTYSGDLLPPYYIGSTSIKKIESGYNGSPTSKMYCSIWNNERNNNPHLFKTVILNRHTTREEAYLDEQKWQVKLNVVESDLFVNRSVQTSTGFTTNGIAMSEEQKAKISASATGNKKSEDHKAKLSVSQTGKTPSEKTKAKISQTLKGNAPWNTGKTLSEETKAKISKTLIGTKHSEEAKIKMREAKARRKNG